MAVPRSGQRCETGFAPPKFSAISYIWMVAAHVILGCLIFQRHKGVFLGAFRTFPHFKDSRQHGMGKTEKVIVFVIPDNAALPGLFRGKLEQEFQRLACDYGVRANSDKNHGLPILLRR